MDMKLKLWSWAGGFSAETGLFVFLEMAAAVWVVGGVRDPTMGVDWRLLVVFMVSRVFVVVSVNKEEIEEIARGLELSNVNFIWVVNFSFDEKISGSDKILPEGYIERVKERGMIVAKWAPQAKILRHSNIGGFLNHCGSNSILESLYFGVPLIAMPVLVDQFIAARYMVELGVGLEVKREENGKVKAEEIAKAIKNLMVEKKGEELRDR
uniref:Crocetin glucoside glucosyltransferase-like n=1 Tax=Nicotiana sylvestris TaxID=4096 RepID=A0A1U7YKA5_NICSY|nr:PREDICTED: crocetin glucoside glucosyltransferase-like [Nicotiana sylvestris]